MGIFVSCLDFNFNFKGLMMILHAQTNFAKFLEQVLEVLKEVEIDKTECSIL
ncbi:hypothetical protein BTM351_07250 [Helicobacter pylori]